MRFGRSRNAEAVAHVENVEPPSSEEKGEPKGTPQGHKVGLQMQIREAELHAKDAAANVRFLAAIYFGPGSSKTLQNDKS